MATKNPATVTIYGRLSFPRFTYAEALANNQKSPNPSPDPAKVKPDFSMLVEQAQLDKFVNHVENVFLPFCLSQHAAGEKRNALDAKQIERIKKVIDSDWEDQPPYIPIKPVDEKTLALAPEVVASIKVQGQASQDFVLKAIVNSEDELAVPDPDVLQFPIIKPISATVHDLYPGCYVAATLNLYTYLSGKVPGLSAGANVAIFKADGERFGGGVEVDEDEIFAD